MRAVIQRSQNASVCVNGELVSSINSGMVILVCVEEGDTEKDAQYIAEKAVNLRIFSDQNDIPNLSLVDTKQEMLAISQFTLAADARKGRRPSYSNAASPKLAKPIFELFCTEAARFVPVKTGIFQTDMKVSLINDGPFTVLLSSRKEF